MAKTKVALLAIDAPEMPAWVSEKFEKAGHDFVFEECTTREAVERVGGDADVVWLFGGSLCLNGNLDVLTRCGAIVRTGSGTDNVPVAEATERGILVANTPAAIADTVAEHAIGLLFAVSRKIAIQDRMVHQGVWDRKTHEPNHHLQGQTLGLIGFGHIARRVAAKLKGFELRVLVFAPFVDDQVIRDAGAEKAELDDVLAQADYVSVHTPLMDSTRGLIGARELALMKPSAILINTSRGPVLEEHAVYEVLKEKRIAGAGLDVLEKEPPDKDTPLFGLENVVLTPHIAPESDIELEMLWKFSVETALDLAEKRFPRSYVNRDVKPKWDLAERERVGTEAAKLSRFNSAPSALVLCAR